MRRLMKLLRGTVLIIILFIGGFVVFNWAPDLPLDELKARWAQSPSMFVGIDGMQVHIRDQGPRDDPEPLLLLHGTSASLHTWQGWVEQLEHKHRVISIDLPGFGLTGPFPDGNYTVERYQRFLQQLFAQLKLKRVTLIGNSFGGQLAWLYALNQPQQVGRLVLVDAAGYPRQSNSVPLGFRLAQNPILAPLMGKILPYKMIESSVRNVYGDPSKVTDELIDRYYQLTLREGNRQALRERFHQVKNTGYAQLKQLQVPTLIIWGGEDRLIPVFSAERFATDIAGSRLVIFEDLGHVPQEEDPLRTSAALITFLGD
ncbi:alpha/beta fold hydrolase [Pseudomonas sp. M30-35]|uniref:alpha/beta fold hydrolase n=1 Tax=Pseudomonas sp. M30-35 TaxID=1981174 RepID=UPI000B3D2850|nr:alpha/beta hydrolase [Pseudomonas sp. M30-35]ARU87413.1 alpha/beta hydrolase [Pseudomonas sp. M30-35]